MDESRKQFEEWVAEFYPGGDITYSENDGEYNSWRVDELFRSWQASRQSLEDNQ
ncbi:hypothetical protein [Rosenbergiella epipactidis]|uniref:hypothetical protein n=1 Tax=Rosenbergiella epipactidis TaxID=1544694 RepID=UPI001F4D6CEC|nr:hypothetical protein [Rosenbergiella epipactidis]